MKELFTSFAISVAANIVTTLFARTSSEKEIRTAFQDAIEEWCPNEEIRRFREPTIYSFLKKYIDNPAINEDELTEEQRSFLEVFQKKLAEHQAATNYLSGVKERKYYDEVMSTLHVVNNKLDIIKKKLDAVDPRHEELHFMAVAEIFFIVWRRVTQIATPHSQRENATLCLSEKSRRAQKQFICRTDLTDPIDFLFCVGRWEDETENR